MTSSKISSAPTRSHSARSPSRNPGAGAIDAHVGGDRLDDHGGDLLVELRHLVVRHDERLGDRAGGHAGRAGQAERGHAAAAGGEQGVGGAVEVAVER